MLGLTRLDLGRSLWTGEAVSKEIALRAPVSFQIAIMAGLIAILIAIPLGTLSALYRDSWIDHSVRVVAVSGLAIPSFWLGMLIILGLLSLFNWLPKIGYVPLWEDPLTNLSVTIWPAASVGYRYAAVATRMMRSSLLEVMREDYIRTARAKGVWTRLIMRRHALRNALLPVVTVIGLEFAFLIGGLVVTEQVFNINGIGKLFVDATARGDFNLIQGLVLFIATCFILINLLVDLLYGWLDPRIRLN
jgi:peptide/nickel transport system permease protein